MRRVRTWLPRPGKFTVAWTVYSFGLSGDHRLTCPRPVRLSLAVLIPGEVTFTVVVCAAICVGPSSSSTSRVPVACVVAAESMVHSTSTRGCELSTSAGWANRSERNTFGSTRSRTSR